VVTPGCSDVSDFLRNGIPASLLATSTILTVGYLLMRLIGL
jgi:phosphate transporter